MELAHWAGLNVILNQLDALKTNMLIENENIQALDKKLTSCDYAIEIIYKN